MSSLCIIFVKMHRKKGLNNKHQNVDLYLFGSSFSITFIIRQHTCKDVMG